MRVPFECDLCHYRNINRRDPVWSCPKDMATLVAIRRVNLDVFWARESSTVTGNLSRMRRDITAALSAYTLGDNLLPTFENPRLHDRVGMRLACIMLRASLNEGIYCDTVQFDTVRKTRAWIGNVFNASSEYDGSPLDLDAGLFVSVSPTDKEWFRRFVRGMQLRMGVVKFQNEALSSAMVLGLCKLLDDAWQATVNEDTRERLEGLMVYIIIGCGAGLRGEEVPLLSLKGLRDFWVETRDDPEPFIMATLYGRFKGETGYRWHCLPICDSSRSGIPRRLWVGRLMHRRVEVQGRTNGWLFRGPKGRRARIKDFDSDFQDWINRLHATSPEIFSKGTLLAQFSLRRSLRRGAVLETFNRVDRDIVTLMNRWRTKEGARGADPGLGMWQTYTQVRSLVPELKLYSQAH